MDISPTKLSQDAGISLSFASMLLSRKRQPSALTIYDKTGLKLGLLEGQPEEVIDSLRPKAAA
jgi:hypothetical protein